LVTLLVTANALGCQEYRNEQDHNWQLSQPVLTAGLACGIVHNRMMRRVLVNGLWLGDESHQQEIEPRLIPV